MRSRDAEIQAVAQEINDLVEDLNATVAALNGILNGAVSSGQEGEPDDHQRRQPAS